MLVESVPGLYSALGRLTSSDTKVEPTTDVTIKESKTKYYYPSSRDKTTILRRAQKEREVDNVVERVFGEVFWGLVKCVGGYVFNYLPIF